MVTTHRSQICPEPLLASLKPVLWDSGTSLLLKYSAVTGASAKTDAKKLILLLLPQHKTILNVIRLHWRLEQDGITA